MARGQYLSPYQQGVVRRYYDQRDTLVLQKLGDIVSNLAALDDPMKAGPLWKNAAEALKKTPADQMRALSIVANRNVEALARLVADLQKPGAMDAPQPGSPASAPAAPTSSPAAPAASATPAGPLGSARDGTMTSRPLLPPPPAKAPTDPLAPENLKAALKAFKKRMKITRLDDESRLSARALTGGRRSAVVAIQAPSTYPKAVWEKLADEGKLKRSGGGLYELVEG